MKCRSLNPNALPAKWWHCLWCAECRRARAVDMNIAFEVRKLRWELPPLDGVSRTLSALDVAEYGHTRKRLAWRVARRWLLRGCLGFAGVTGLLVTYLIVVNIEPKIMIPTPKMPSPNAFDYFLKASTSLRDGKSLDEVQSSLTSHRRADTHVYSPAEMESLVKENAGVVALLHKGFQYPYMNPPARSFTTQFPYLADFRATSRFLNLKARTEAQRGDWNAAVNSDLDSVQMGEMIPRGGVLIADLVGIACQSIGRQPAWKTVDHLNASQARAAAGRLESLMALHSPYADALQEEEWCAQAGLMEVFRKGSWRHDLLVEGADNGESLRAFGQELRILFYGKGRLLNVNKRYMDRIIADARQPYAKKRIPDPIVPDDPISAIIMPVFSQAYFKDVSSEAQNALLLTTLALHAYRLEHSSYPKTLDALAPTYLKRLPDDPFALQGPLHYKRVQTGYALYSIGPDGKDDDGRAVDNLQQWAQSHTGAFPLSPPLNHDQRLMVNQDSTGDIVAGVNTQ